MTAHFFTRRRQRRGSTLIAVILITTMLGLLAASLIGWSITERRLNLRNAMRLESRNAAEALAEYGFSQIRQKFETRSTFSLNPTGSDALVYPPDSFWTGSHVNAVVPATVNTSNSGYSTTKLELIGGTINNVTTGSTGSLYYVDPADQNNEFDPLKGKWVFRRDVSVLGRATVFPASGATSPITSYVMEKISVRGAPLFAHAIFYNMDLEIFPGPDMTISGPVHANGNLYLYPGATLNFTDQVTCTGGVYHAAKPNDSSSDGSSASTRTGSVNIPDKSLNEVNLYTSYWRDSTKGNGTSGTAWSDFRTTISQVYNGNLQTGAFGIQNYSPVAIGTYKEQTTTTTDNSINTGRTIIEPTNYPVSTDPDYSSKMEVEEQKFSNDAGIYIQVTPGTGSITITSRSKTDPTKNKSLTLTSGSNLITYTPYQSVNTSYSVGSKITSGTNKNKYPVTPTISTSTSAGTTTTTGSVTYSSSNSTPASTSVLNSGMYDQHRQLGIDTIDVNMDSLRNAVAVMAGQSSYKNSAGSTVAVDTTHNVLTGLTTADWTGVIYVEVAGAPTTNPITGATISATNSASIQTGVRLINGGGKLPSYGTASPGLTVATNAPVYIKGNYNADGNTGSNVNGSADPSKDAETGEVPAAIAADAITILSAGFDDATSLSTKNPSASATTEISAAFLTGITPSNKNGNGQSSGGAHNLPRFLENWSGKSTYIRGSLVCLFESRVFTQPYNGSGYYSPPTRNWGFNSLFRQGIYPPGTPKVQSYRRVDFTDLSASEYATERAKFGW
ncbi:MAG TPA: hypothetical protein VL357_08905 [Rariglobus sp.]|jgi:hypothetical protein|nr:hypothetical protein [Rariglobus sp.]